MVPGKDLRLPYTDLKKHNLSYGLEQCRGGSLSSILKMIVPDLKLHWTKTLFIPDSEHQHLSLMWFIWDQLEIRRNTSHFHIQLLKKDIFKTSLQSHIQVSNLFLLPTIDSWNLDMYKFYFVRKMFFELF